MKEQRSRSRGFLAAMTVAAFLTTVGTVQAQAPKAAASGGSGDIRLYGFSSGALTIGKGALINFAPMDPPITVPVGFYVIKHPKGNVLFDTGNNDKLITDPT